MDSTEFEKWWMRQPPMSSVIAAREAWNAAIKLMEEEISTEWIPLNKHQKSEISNDDFDNFTSYTRPFST
jgi:hypothetical protein